MQYSNRSSYENRNERPFYPSRQYDDNSEYENSEYGNTRYKNPEGFNEMFITRVPQKVYYNEYLNENMFYNIKEYHENSDSQYFTNSFFYYINNKEQFHDAHKNKPSKNKNKIKFKNDVNVNFVVVFYYVMINKINEKLIYRKCYKKFFLTIFCMHISNRNLIEKK